MLKTSDYNTSHALILIKRGIWLYFILLIFEGALRKWVVPGLSNPLLLVRDPIALWLLYMANKHKIDYSNAYTKIMIPLTVLCFYIAVAFCHQNYYVAAFGSRITLIHYPLVFLIAKVFDENDVINIGKFIVMILPPMAVLIIVQFYSPQSAWINRGVGGNVEGAGFSGINGYFRPPGTFSFTAGNSIFFSFAAPFVFYFLFYSKALNKLFVYGGLIAVLLSIPFSISRSILFAVLITLFFTALSFAQNSKQIGRILGGIIGFVLVLYLASKSSLLETSFSVFTARFNSANESEGGAQGILIDRVLGGLINGIIHAGDYNRSFWGLGIGYGTNFASKLVTGTSEVFLVDEAEWGRIIGELGPILGLILVTLRIGLTYDVVNGARKQLKKRKPFAWLLLSFSGICLLQGGWSTPTNLGFYVISGGVTLALLKDSNNPKAV
jgi:hypothetical protein